MRGGIVLHAVDLGLFRGVNVMENQKWALYRAAMAVNLVAYADRQYAVSYPWRDIDGAITETKRDSYTNARATCANMRAYWAMICMGYDRETAAWATNKTMWRGGARDQLSQACRMAGQVMP